MKHLFWTFILGIFIGIALQIYCINSHYPGIDNEVTHDTIRVDSIVRVDSIETKVQMPKTFVISLDSISIDTINTIVNGKVTDTKFKISIK